MSLKAKIKDMTNILPGFVAALLIAAVAKWLESLLPIHVVGASVIALFIGMGINSIKKPGKTIVVGLKFTSKKILKLCLNSNQIHM